MDAIYSLTAAGVVIGALGYALPQYLGDPLSCSPTTIPTYRVASLAHGNIGLNQASNDS